ncbi:MAG: DinB family protein [Thermoanaerobaculia bacterium]|jgi:uncharacterized damage-inducible protein DinB
MSIAEQVLPEFDREMAITRRVLERASDERLAWRPHAKSQTFGGLATHLANIPTWVGIAIGGDSFDAMPKDAPPPRAILLGSREAILETFDRNVTAARAAIGAATDEHLHGPWSLLAGGEVRFTMPRTAVLRSFVLNHLIHHRGQFSVYLRLCDIPVPSIYGPSADELQ